MYTHREMAPSVPVKLGALAELEETDLEYTIFYPGFLLDYYTEVPTKSYATPPLPLP